MEKLGEADGWVIYLSLIPLNIPIMLLTNNDRVDVVSSLDAIEGIRNSLISRSELINAYTNAMGCDEGRQWLREKGVLAMPDFETRYWCVCHAHVSGQNHSFCAVCIGFLMVVLCFSIFGLLLSPSFRGDD